MMALDKLVDSSQLDTDLTSVANAIRTKGGTSAQLAFPSGFVSAVQAIPTGTTPTGTKQISITANGTTTEDVAAYANAEITVNVPSAPAGMVLLASGTHVHNGSTYLTIPVSYTGTAKYVFVCVDEVKDATAQCIAAERWFSCPFSEIESDYAAFCKNGSVTGSFFYYGRNSSNSYNGNGVAANSSNLGQMTISATQIRFNKISSTYPWAANTYHWYIYGEAAT